MLKESDCSREQKRSKCETAQLLPERRRRRSVIRDAASETGRTRGKRRGATSLCQDTPGRYRGSQKDPRGRKTNHTSSPGLLEYW